MDASEQRRRFAIALSFPGERRPFVAEVAQALMRHVGEGRVLNDQFFEAEFARVDLDVYLPELYRQQSDLIVLFLCPGYAKKKWCGLEFRHIRQLIGTPDKHRIMFTSFGSPGDMSELGILRRYGYVDVDGRSPAAIADLILQRYRQLVPPGEPAKAPPVPCIADVSRLPRAANSLFLGRDAELDALDVALADRSCGVYVLVASGGTGKTALVEQWLQRQEGKGWPGLRRAFAWSFYSQGTKAEAPSSDRFFREALAFFGFTGDMPKDAIEQQRQLAMLVKREAALLVLDGLEPLQHPPGSYEGKLKDTAVGLLLRSMRDARDGLCLVTTRFDVADVAGQPWSQSRKLDYLSPEAGAEILRQLGADGTADERQTASRFVHGHALSLLLLGHYVRDVLDGKASRFREANLADEDLPASEHAGKVMDAYAAWFRKNGRQNEANLLLLLGLFDRPVPPDLLQALLTKPAIFGLTDQLVSLPEAKVKQAVAHLAAVGLLLKPEGGKGWLQLPIDAHPLVREHFGKRLADSNPKAWKIGHLKVYERLKASKPDLPETAADVEPLWQAIGHGCRAGRWQ